MASPIGKVAWDDLESFLRRNGDVWRANAPREFEDSLDSLVVTTEELIDAFNRYRPDLGYVYLFSYEEAPYEAVGKHWPDNVDSVDASQLDRFEIRARGGDFLWIAPSDEDASNASYISLCRHEPDGDQREEA